MATALPATNASTFDPQFPATEEVKKIKADSEQAQVRTLSRIANLSVPVAGGTAKPDSLDATIEQIVAHGETTLFFGNVFSLFQKGQLTRRELDQRLVNWVLKVPGLRQKFDELPQNMKEFVVQFGKSDLSAEEPIQVVAQKFPSNSAIMKQTTTLTKALEAQLQIDKGEKYPDVLENDGSRVKYVQDFKFVNWGETLANTPSVCFSAIRK